MNVWNFFRTTISDILDFGQRALFYGGHEPEVPAKTVAPANWQCQWAHGIFSAAAPVAFGMDQWTGVHRAFVIRAYYKSNDSISGAQRLFKKQFSIYQTPPTNVIKSWLRHFESTGSSQGGCGGYARSSLPVSWTYRFQSRYILLAWECLKSHVAVAVFEYLIQVSNLQKCNRL